MQVAEMRIATSHEAADFSGTWSTIDHSRIYVFLQLDRDPRSGQRFDQWTKERNAWLGEIIQWSYENFDYYVSADYLHERVCLGFQEKTQIMQFKLTFC